MEWGVHVLLMELGDEGQSLADILDGLAPQA
jgi:hypothetical protein